MCNSIILKLEDISSIKRYFEFILSQTEKGEKFPIKLDDVFALVYSRKDKAVRALIDSDQFMQDIDYKVFPLNGGNSNGGSPSMVYMLSVSCLEYFIARKVRSVFEVYRSVFHGCVYNEKRKLIPDFSNPAEAARAWADQYEAAQRAIAEKSQAEAEKQQALKTIEEHKPDVEFAESFRKVDHNNMWLIRDIAKKLEQDGVIIAEKIEHVKSVLEASVDYFYPNHPEVEFEKDFNIQYDVNNILNKYGHTEMGLYKIQLYVEKILGSIQNKKPVDVGEVSDGYHTFNELYRYRMLYNAAFFNLLARSGQVEVCKSRRHSDGEKCFGSDDWFIVMAILPTGQVSNHYESKYWDLFDVPERETAFEYDGHTPNEAADRLEKYLKLPRHGMTFEKALERLKLGRKIKRIDWGKKYICMFDVNILMIDTGKKVASNWNPTEHDIMSNDWEIAE